MNLPEIRLSFKLLILVCFVIIVGSFLFMSMNYKKVVRIEEKQKNEVQLPPIKIKVINGCGVDALAGRFNNSLDNNLFDKMGTSNTHLDIYNKSIIVVRRNKPRQLEFLKKTTGIERVIFAIKENAKQSFDLILGFDYKQLELLENK